MVKCKENYNIMATFQKDIKVIITVKNYEPGTIPDTDFAFSCCALTEHFKINVVVPSNR